MPMDDHSRMSISISMFESSSMATGSSSNSEASHPPPLSLSHSSMSSTCSTTAPPNSLPPPPPPPHLLHQHLEHTEGTLEKLLDICGTPGLCIGAIDTRDGRVLTKSFGFRDASSHLPVDANSKFMIGSVSKTFLSAAIAIAADEKLIGFQDLVSTFIPSLNPIQDPRIRTAATISDCLAHKSGLANPQILLCGPDNLPLQTEGSFVEFVNAFPTQLPDGQQRFGLRWNYSNSSYALPALALQNVYGCRYSKFLDERILRPLGMTRTVSDPQNIDENIAFPHVRLADSSFVKLDTTHITDTNHTPLLAAYGKQSTVNDLLKWCKFFLSSTAFPDINSPSNISDPAAGVPNETPAHYTLLDVSPSQLGNIFSRKWMWDRDTPHAFSYCHGWTRIDLPSSKFCNLSYNSAARHPSRKQNAGPQIIGASSLPRPVFQSSGLVNGSACCVSLFPSDHCAIVACANGITDGDAPAWATKILAQQMFDLEPKIDFIALAREEAQARRDDFDRMLYDLIQKGPVPTPRTLFSAPAPAPAECSTGPSRDVDHDKSLPAIVYSPSPRSSLRPPFPLDVYCGTYRAISTTITITLPTPGFEFGSSPMLVATFNGIPSSRQPLRWLGTGTDSWTWFPLARDEWLLRAMFDWDYWKTGVFDFVRTKEGNIGGLDWQWDEWERATRFERL